MFVYITLFRCYNLGILEMLYITDKAGRDI